MTKKFCKSCGQDKPLNDFSGDSRGKFGKNFYCRACLKGRAQRVPRETQQKYQQKWRSKDGNREKLRKAERERYAANPEVRRGDQRRYRERHPQRVKDVLNARRTLHRNRIAAFKAERGCEHCGISDHRVLDLHHTSRDDKVMAVSQLYQNAAWAKVEAEMEKCRVLCSNCHRIEHYEEWSASRPSQMNGHETA